jgi:pyrroloquinoline quinone (PQQ) biosynthesis protein C
MTYVRKLWFVQNNVAATDGRIMNKCKNKKVDGSDHDKISPNLTTENVVNHKNLNRGKKETSSLQLLPL